MEKISAREWCANEGDIVCDFFFFFKQKTAYEIYQCDWSSDVCSSDLDDGLPLPQPWQRNTVSLTPGKTYDIIIKGDNRGIWTFHDHDTRRVTNNGLYPGGNLLALVYEDLPKEETSVGKMGYLPKIALDE